MYDAINPSRPGLPPLVVVLMIVELCGGDQEAWVDAWRVLMMAEFDRNNPSMEDLV